MMTTLMLLSFIPSPLKAAEETKSVAEMAAKPVETSLEATQLARLEEIKAMDMSLLSRSEKKELRNEVKAIKNDQDERGRRGYGHDRMNGDGHRRGGVVFVTAGGGLLIVLLLILLL